MIYVRLIVKCDAKLCVLVSDVFSPYIYIFFSLSKLQREKTFIKLFVDTKEKPVPIISDIAIFSDIYSLWSPKVKIVVLELFLIPTSCKTVVLNFILLFGKASSITDSCLCCFVLVSFFVFFPPSFFHSFLHRGTRCLT